MATNPWYRDEEDRRPVVVFGNLASSALARVVLEHDSPYRVAAFTVDAAYCNGYFGMSAYQPVKKQIHVTGRNMSEIRMLVHYLTINIVRRVLPVLC